MRALEKKKISTLKRRGLLETAVLLAKFLTSLQSTSMLKLLFIRTLFPQLGPSLELPVLSLKSLVSVVIRNHFILKQV